MRALDLDLDPVFLDAICVLRVNFIQNNGYRPDRIALSKEVYAKLGVTEFDTILGMLIRKTPLLDTFQIVVYREQDLTLNT